MSLADEISKLANPLPTFDDPEDVIDDTAAKLLSRHNDQEQFDSISSKLRARAAAQLPEEDAKYCGKRISRHSFTKDDQSSEEDDDNDSDDSGDDDLSTESDYLTKDDGDVIRSDEEEEQLAGFKEKLKFQEPTEDILFSGDGDCEGDDDDNDDTEESTEDSDDEDESSEESEGEEWEQGENGDMQKFTKVNVEEEIQKGKAVKAQLSIWDSFLEGRIKLQKALLITNQLPQCDVWEQFVEAGGTEYNKALQESEKFLQKLLEQLVELQTKLLLQNPDTKNIVTSTKESIRKSPVLHSIDDNEEITSDSEDDDDEDDDEKKSQSSTPNLKRKLTHEQYPEFLAKRHMDFQPFRNTTIQKWYDKTRISSGRLSKGFSAFDQSALKQIDQILGDKERLVRRTQLKRAAYTILGKLEKKPHSEVPDDTDLQQDCVPLRNHLHDYDDEVFDDDDFYHQQLRELIERKTSDINDPVALSRQWLEIQKLRSKIKKNVDTKASKGRKIRYDVHKKLVSFMAPYDNYQWTDAAKNELYKSLFGQHQSTPNATG